MKSRIMVVLLIMVLLVGLVPVVGAQDTSGCLNLSDSDCTILMNAQGATVSSANIELSASFSLTGISTLSPGSEDVSGEFSGTGAYQLVEGAIVAYLALAVGSQEPFGVAVPEAKALVEIAPDAAVVGKGAVDVEHHHLGWGRQ